jgi:hypothetical protein
MRILPYCCVLLFFSILLPGCYQNKKPLDNIRVQDLFPQNPAGDSNTSAVGLYIYEFQFDKENYPAAFDGLGEANDFTIKYGDVASFAANGFICGGGDSDTWTRLAQILTQVQSTITKRSIVYINFNTDHDVFIAQQSEPVFVSYHSDSNALAGIGLPPGDISLRLNAAPTILKQICNLSIKPVYLSRSDRVAADIADSTPDKTLKEQKTSTDEFVFDSAAINVALRPGQFVYIAPDIDNFPRDGSSVAGLLMFCSDIPKPVIRLCIITCGRIND